MRRRNVFLVCGIFILALLACGESTNNAAQTVSGAGASPTTAPTSQHFKVSDTVKVGSTWQININSVKTSQGQDFSTPKSGNVFLLVDVTLKNLSGQEQNVSSLLMFGLKDETGMQYTESITGFTTSPNGKVEAGGLLRGTVAYEVPATAHKFTFSFQADIILSGQAIWDISV